MALSPTRLKNSDNQSWLIARYALLWTLLITLVLLPRLLNLDIFIGPDELAELGRDNSFALALARGDPAGTLVGDGKPSVTLMWINTLGVTGKWLWLHLSGAPQAFEQVVAPERPFSVWPERRLFLALVSGLQILAAWPLLRRIWNEQIATLAVGLMALEPFLLAFTRIIRGDALLAGFMILSLLGALAFLKTGWQGHNLFSGAMAGLALLTKLSGGAVVVTVILLYGIALFMKDEDRGMKAETLNPSSIIFWLLAAGLIFFGMWPAWWFRPLETFDLLWNKGLFHAVEAGQERAGLYFWGAIHPSGPGPWFYPALAGLRLTPWLLLGSFVAVGRWLGSTLRRATPNLIILSGSRFARPGFGNPGKNGDLSIPFEQKLDLLILGVLVYTGVYWLTITLPGQKLDRFFTPLVPALCILTAIEVIYIIHWLSEKIIRHSKLVPITPNVPRTTLYALRLTYSAIILIGLALTWHISRYHPLYSTYFNPLSGSPQFWQWALPIGHGEGVNSALLHLSSQGDMTTKTLVCGTNLPRCEPFFPGKLLPQEELRSGAWFKADYVLWHVDEEQMDVFPAGVLAYLRRQPPVYTAHYHGLDYTWLVAVPRPAFLTSDAKLEGVARLFGYDAAGQDFSRLKPGETVNLHLYWQNEGQAHKQQFRWWVVDGSGYIWSEAAAQPLPEFKSDAAQKGAVIEGTVSLPLPSDMPPGAYTLQASFANARGDVGQFPLPAAGRELLVSGPPTGPTQPQQLLERQMSPDLRLRGYTLSSEEAIPGETLWLALHWQSGAILRDYLLTLRLLDSTGQVMKTWNDLQPVSSTYPTSIWPANSYIRGPQPVSLPSDLPLGQYQLGLSLFDAATGAPLLPDEVKLGLINVVSRKTSFDIPPMQFPAQAVFGEVATLLGYDLAGELSPNGARVMVTLYWQAQRKTARPYQVQVRLVDGNNGTVLAEQSVEPAQGAAPSTLWQTGEIIADRHELAITNNKPTSVRLEIQLLADALQPTPLADGQPLFVVPEVQQKVSWQTP